MPCPLQGIFPTQRSNRSLLCLLHWQVCSFTTAAAAAKSLQSCPTLCDPIDGSPLRSAVPGILQTIILERQGIFPTQRSNRSLLCLLHWQVYSFTTGKYKINLEHLVVPGSKEVLKKKKQKKNTHRKEEACQRNREANLSVLPMDKPGIL